MRFKLINHNHVLIVSGLLFIVSLLSLYLLYQPPQLTKLFHQTKSGSLNLQSPASIVIDQPFKLDIQMDTANQSTNAVGVYLKYDPNKLRLINIDTTQSFCQFYPEKKYDNSLGIVSLACGSPHPGVSGKNTVMTLEFIPLAIGNTTISTDPKSKILLSDGKGTNILTNPPIISLNILQGL